MKFCQISSQARRQDQPNWIHTHLRIYWTWWGSVSKYQAWDRSISHWHWQAVRVEKRLKLLGSQGYVDDKVILEDEMQAYMIEGQCCWAKEFWPLSGSTKDRHMLEFQLATWWEILGATTGQLVLVAVGVWAASAKLHEPTESIWIIYCSCSHTRETKCNHRCACSVAKCDVICVIYDT